MEIFAGGNGRNALVLKKHGNREREREVTGEPSDISRHFAFAAVEVERQTQNQRAGIKLTKNADRVSQKGFPVRSFDRSDGAYGELKFVTDGDADVFGSDIERDYSPRDRSARNILKRIVISNFFSLHGNPG